MLRINQQKSVQGAKSYFEEGLAREDYYSNEAIVGRWGGKGAESLGLVAPSSIVDLPTVPLNVPLPTPDTGLSSASR